MYRCVRDNDPICPGDLVRFTDSGRPLCVDCGGGLTNEAAPLSTSVHAPLVDHPLLAQPGPARRLLGRSTADLAVDPKVWHKEGLRGTGRTPASTDR